LDVGGVIFGANQNLASQKKKSYPYSGLLTKFWINHEFVYQHPYMGFNGALGAIKS